MNAKQRREAAATRGLALVKAIQAEKREPTAAESAKMKAACDEIDECDKIIDAVEKDPGARAFAELSSTTMGGSKSEGSRLSFKGKAASAAISEKAAPRGGGVKALLDVGSTSTVPLDVGTEVIATGRPASSLFELIPAEEVSGSTVSYLVQSARNLAAAPVAAGSV